MNVLRRISVISITLITIGLLISCENNDRPDFTPRLVQVGSVEVSNIIVANNPFDIKFYGLVGINSCSEFSHFETDKLNNEILIECWGKDYSSSAPCLDVLTSLKDQKLSYLIEESGNYLIRIKQPDDSFLEKEIIVE